MNELQFDLCILFVILSGICTILYGIFLDKKGGTKC